MIDQIISFLYSALFFLTPLIMTKSTSELFEFNKMLFIYVITVLVSFFWLLKMILSRKIILKKTFLDIPIVVFFISQLISTIFSIDIHTSIFGYYGRFNGGLISIICYIVLYYGLVSNIINIEKLLKSIIISSSLVIFWAIPGHFGRDLTCLLFTGQFNNSCWDNTTLAFRPELRAFSTLGQPNWLGAYLAVAFFIGIYFLIKNFKNERANHASPLRIWTDKYLILNTCYLILNFSMILMSRSRSAIFAVLVGLVLFTGYYFFFIKSNFKKILVILLVVTIVPAFLFKTGETKIDKILNFEFSILNFQKKPVSSLVPNGLVPSPSLNVTESFDIRKVVWEGAWKVAKRYPFFGSGVETFAYSYNFVRPVAHNLTSEWDYVYNKAHNEYFNYLATTGFVGVISYLLLIFGFIFYVFLYVIPAKAGIQNKKHWIPFFKGMTKPITMKSTFAKATVDKQSNNETILVVCLLISYITILITNFFGFSTTTIQLFFFLIPAFVFSTLDSIFRTEQKFLFPTNLQKLVIFLLLSSTIYLLSSIVVYYLADVNYSYGLKYSKVNDQQKAAGYFEKALKMRQEPVYMDRFSSSLAYLSAVANIQKQTELAKQIASLSDTYNRKTIQDYPKNVFYWKTRAKNMYYFYQITDNDNELLQGIEALKTTRDIYPTDPKIPYTLALYYSIIYDTTKNNPEKKEWQKLSLQEINKSIKLKSNYQEAYKLKEELLRKYQMTNDK